MSDNTAQRRVLFSDLAEAFDLPRVFVRVSLVVFDGEFAERVALLVVSRSLYDDDDNDDSVRTVIDAHGKSDAELIRRAIKEFDERVALERARWGR